jgi:ABC-type proline/glycine betaine transport system permease subunit
MPHALSYRLTYSAHMAHGKACGYFLAGYLKEADPADAAHILSLAGFESIDALEEYYVSTCGRDEVPIVITMLIALPPVWKNLETGILSADPSLLQMGKALGLPLWKRVLYIWIPSVLPHFRSSVQTAIGLGWKAGIAAEILSLPTTSVGREIYNANLLLETTDLFAWTLSVVLLSLLIELAISGLLGRLTRFGESSAQRRREAQ